MSGRIQHIQHTIHGFYFYFIGLFDDERIRIVVVQKCKQQLLFSLSEMDKYEFLPSMRSLSQCLEYTNGRLFFFVNFTKRTTPAKAHRSYILA